MRSNRTVQSYSRISLVLTTLLFCSVDAIAGQLQLSWVDNSTNEDGFKIERKTGTTGTYAQITAVGANVTSYTDSSLVDGTTYCYQVRAYNSAGDSPYAPEACGTAGSTVQTFSLVTTKTGTGTGTVTSTDGGINCGSTCSQVYNSGTIVQLTASAAAGSVFSGWSGTGCSSTGSVTIDANKTCTATFTLQPVATFNLTVTKSGTGTGTITSIDGGINCGSGCTTVYNSGTSVTLNAAPAAGSIFSGWSGCCFSKSATLTINLVANTTVTANFIPQTTPVVTSGVEQRTRIGLFRPNTGEWFLDLSGNGIIEDCTIDICVSHFGGDGMLPVVGDWVVKGKSNIGTFDPATGSWHLDHGSFAWDACGTPSVTCISSFGQTGDLPVVKEANNSDQIVIGIYRPQSSTSKWRSTSKPSLWKFDTNGDAKLGNCTTDSCFNFGVSGDLPLVGDWNGDGTDKIGAFRPSLGQWFLDVNGNGKWDGSPKDTILGPFGLLGDRPIVGDWDGNGKTKIGVFRPSTGEWFLDLNGNGIFDGCQSDICIGTSALYQQGDLPVVGKW
jgi:List-Bact-rpt repeat protein